MKNLRTSRLSREIDIKRAYAHMGGSVAQSDHRYVHFFELATKSRARDYPDGFAPLEILKIAEAIEQAWKLGEAVQAHRGGQTTYISDVQIQQRTACILLNVSDKNASDPAFSDVQNKTRRVVPKVAQEGLDTAAHLIFKLHADPGKPARYRAILEVAVNLSVMRVERFLNRILRIAAARKRFWIEDPTGALIKGKPKLIRIKPIVEFRGIPSQEFISDLQEGTFSGIELISYKGHATPWDSHSYVVEDKSVICLKANPAKATQKAFAVVNSLLQRKSKDFDEALISFKTDTGLDRSIRVNTDMTLPGENYVKKGVIEQFSQPLPSSFSKIHPEIFLKMADLLP